MENKVFVVVKKILEILSKEVENNMESILGSVQMHGPAPSRTLAIAALPDAIQRGSREGH